jgi:prepilin-type N-terminal cleavage/methylation domain-containing protein
MIKKIKKQNSGFTIIELIVVFGVISILSSYLILYNKVSQSQIILSLEQAKIIELLNQAKSLSISTYLNANASCGYGVNINYSQPESYELFSYGISGPGCKNIQSIDTSSSTYVLIGQKNTLPKELKFNNATSNYLNTIFYMPPQPKILIWANNNPTPIDENSPNNYDAKIYLKTQDNSLEKIIKVNIMGQISF